MHFGLVISVLFHAAILGWTFVAFQSQRELSAPEPEAVAVGMITPSELTKVRLGTRTAKQPEAEATDTKGEVAKKEAAKPRPVAAAPPPPAAEPPATKAEQKLDPIARKLAEAPPPLPSPAPAAPAADAQKKREAAEAKEKLDADAKRRADEQRQADERRRMEDERRAEEKKRAAEQKKAEEQKRVAEQKKAEEARRLEEQRRQAEAKRKAAEKRRRDAAARKKLEDEKKRREAEMAAKSKFDADRIAALLNKVRDKSAPPPSAAPDQPTKAKGPALGAREGRDKQISASEIAMLNGIIETRLKPCWRPISGGGGSDTPAVTLRWHLHPDGSLNGDPVVIESTRNDALFRLAAEAAIRAVRECAPFPLPPDKYHVWRTITRHFDPKHML